jgi:hypothetical protein
VECAADVRTLLGMSCIPLPSSGQVASSKKGRTTASKEEKTEESKKQFIIKILWGRHFYSTPKLKLEPDVLHSAVALMLNTFINDHNN